MSRSRHPARTRRTAAKRRDPKPQSLLILHLDAERLRSDGLHLQSLAELTGAVSEFLAGGSVAVRDTTSFEDLNSTLGRLAADHETFDVVVVVAHSNSDGIRIAPGPRGFVGWNVFARYLRPFKPRRILLVACGAGRWDAGEALFDELRPLRRIFACPVNASREFGSLMLLAVPYVVMYRAPRDRHVKWAQVAAIAVTGRQLREWRRTTDKGNPDGAVFDSVADMVDPYARAVPAVLRSILRKKRRG